MKWSIAVLILIGSASALAARRTKSLLAPEARPEHVSSATSVLPSQQTSATVTADEPPFDARKDAEMMTDQLAASGPESSPVLRENTKTLLAEWLRRADATMIAGAEFEEPRCFRAGCYVRGLYESPEQLENMTQSFYRSTLFGDFPGNVGRSAPIAIDAAGMHTVSAIWIVTPPPAGRP